MSKSEAPEKYPDTPAGWYRRWQDELSASKKVFRRFHKESDRVVRRFLDDRKGEQEAEMPYVVSRLNLYHSNITTLMAMLYGRIPKAEVDRRFADADDDIARVAGEILSRMLNTDIEEAGEDMTSVFRNALQDRLVPGLGTARVKYEIEEETVPAIQGETPEKSAEAYQKVKTEWVDIIYTHWKDVLWSPARTYAELRWKAFRSFMGKEKFRARFPEANLDKVNFNSKGPNSKSQDDADENCYPQAEVWEIWDKERAKVFWYTEGYQEILDQQSDPLELDGFWPDPPPMIANATTTRYLPRADWMLAKDLYTEIDELETRISLLTEACKAVGVYDKSNEGVQRIFTEGVENQLIPVSNWGQLSEKGGLDSAIDWVPVKDIAEVIMILTERQNAKIQQLYQVTGMNDVMRGAQTGNDRVSATQRKIEAASGSIRIEALQNEFSRWVSDLLSLKAEIIAKHFQDYCIYEQSNILSTPDAEMAAQAIALIKDPARSRWKISVRPETLAIADYAQLKQDRVEFINALAMFMQSAAPLVEIAPQSMVSLVQLLKWGLAGFKGANEIEGVIDRAVDELTKNPPKPPKEESDAKEQAEIKKMQMEMEMEQQKMNAEMQMAREKHKAEMQLAMLKFQLEKQKAQMEIEQAREEMRMELEALRVKLGLQVQELEIQAEANSQEQAAQFAFNTAEREHEAKIQMESGNAELARDRERAKLKPKSNGNAGPGTVRKSD